MIRGSLLIDNQNEMFVNDISPEIQKVSIRLGCTQKYERVFIKVCVYKNILNQTDYVMVY